MLICTRTLKQRMTGKLKKYKKKKKTKFRLPYFIRSLDNDKLCVQGCMSADVG